MLQPTLSFAVTALIILAVQNSGAVTVRDLRCEYAVNPLGVEVKEPRLSWRLDSAERGQKQTAYQILVASSQQHLLADQGDLWDSGRVPSSSSIQVVYKGKPLSSRQRCYWKVRVWDKNGRASRYSGPSFWEMGLLSPKDWSAEWIGYPAGWPGRALYFRYDFELPRAAQQGRAYIAGLGYYELSLNGLRVGDHVMDPAPTDYSKRVLYATYDITPYLRQGPNAIGVIVGNGWYGMPKLLMQLEVTFADGSSAKFFTRGGHTDLGREWRLTSGPIVANSIYDGEIYDARLEKPGWNRPDQKRPNPHGRTEGWVVAVPVEPPGGRLVSQMIEPIKVVETLTPRSVREPAPGVYVYDAGQNLAGWAALRLRGKQGAQVTLRYAENLKPDGTVNQDNLRKAAATDVYISKGGEVETWEPRFTYHGFRYVQLEGYPGRPTLDELTIKAVRTSVEANGKFECSNALLNRIHQMVWWTEASNLHGIPTDCPQRDERMGWLNDLTVRIEQALYNFHLPRFYAKFLEDVRDTQAEDGSITDTAPFKWGRRPADPVSASYLLLAWELYRHYGDTRAMARHFDGFKAWVNFLISNSDNLIVRYGSWGDWSPPITFGTPGSIGAGAVSRDTPVQLMSTGYLYYCARLLSQMAGILGRKTEQAHYQSLARQVAEAFNRRYWNEAAGGYGANNQAANAFALFLGIVPKERLLRVVGNLVKDVEKHDWHLTTGNLCTKYLLEALTEHGRVDAAYRIVTQETYPSWGFMLANGATTLWERWEHKTGGEMNSHNHPMMGSVGSWFYKYLAGIMPDPQSAGFARIIIRPHVVRDLKWVRAEYTSPHGQIGSFWEREDGKLKLKVRIPVNSTAKVWFPGEDPGAVTEGGAPASSAPGVTFLRKEARALVFEIGSGDYEFVGPE